MSEHVRWAVNLPLPGLALREHRRIVEALPGMGYDDVWTGEGGGIDAFTPLAAAAAWQPRLGLGTGVVPVLTRGPGVLAQTAASLADLAGNSGSGRVLLGIGTSVPAHVTALNGVAFDRPVARVRDTLRFLTAALRGEPVDAEYETFTVRGFQMPATGVKVVLGALRPRMVRLALDEGDGFVTNLLTPADLARVLAEAGPVPEGREIVAKVFVCPTEDVAYARRAGRAFLGWILNQPPYRAFHDRLGRGGVLARSRELFDAGDRRAAGEALPDGLVDDLWLSGPVPELRDRIARYAQPGVTSVLIYVAPTPGLLSGADDLATVLAGLRP
ncbi:putative F420-dependent oxidoreductase [Thermocatellispora tengchongensis]|uniref:Putative F420-dependent oxidoreductase n=1 Tax=Thermocatellispora tengchongensis TaxID=1073253 RepID=A0A840P8C6_9ACTN|nr:LLM class F420-dependent oxidoreductase [Thermocatellispora tengchongensis]MBB5133457.1 putative F420-dependent oxidoreductase [Thermocatellispora tengchongensis]